MHSVEFSAQAAKFLKKADAPLAARLAAKIEALAHDPFPPDSKRVVHATLKAFRVRVGDYRILYVAIPEHHVVLVTEIEKRSRAYG